MAKISIPATNNSPSNNRRSKFAEMGKNCHSLYRQFLLKVVDLGLDKPQNFIRAEEVNTKHA